MFASIAISHKICFGVLVFLLCNTYFVGIIFPQNNQQPIICYYNQGVQTFLAAVKIAKFASQSGQYVRSKIAPTKQDHKNSVQHNLQKCLLQNAFKPKQEDWLPVACAQQATNFKQLVGYAGLEQINTEFNLALINLDLDLVIQDQVGWSTKKKLMVAGVATGVVITGGALLKPVAAKMVLASLAAKTNCVIAATKTAIVQMSLAGKVQLAGKILDAGEQSYQLITALARKAPKISFLNKFAYRDLPIAAKIKNLYTPHKS